MTDTKHALGGWRKSLIGSGKGPYAVEELPGLKGSFIVVDSIGVNCWTRGTGQIATIDQKEAQAVADDWNKS